LAEVTITTRVLSPATLYELARARERTDELLQSGEVPSVGFGDGPVVGTEQSR